MDGTEVWRRDELLTDLDRRYPGIRFRMVDEQGRLRPHMSIFSATNAAATCRADGVDEVVIMQALSSG
ncbi:MAG: hypothetical protein U5K29_08680 [Acidimicrobiales bacterium]|nr:hypothetical protein [Acidimicrobiales bacterium]